MSHQNKIAKNLLRITQKAREEEDSRKMKEWLALGQNLMIQTKKILMTILK